MQCYLIVCIQKITENKNPKVVKTKNGRLMFLSDCVVCGRNKLKLIEMQEASGLLSSLGIRETLSKILLVGSILF